MTTGQRIRNRRKQIGLSAERLADILNVSPATIYRYENGDIEKVPGDLLAPIASALQTTPAFLMGWEDAPEQVIPLSNIEIGIRISTRRQQLGLTMDDVAQEIGVAKSTIQRYETGQIQKIKLPVIESIATALSVNPDWIIGNTDDPTPKVHLYQSPRSIPTKTECSERNIIKIAGRDGSFHERYLSDDQFSMLKALIDQLPEVPEDL